MHKIKEILHKDEDTSDTGDKNVRHSHGKTTEQHHHEHTREAEVGCYDPKNPHPHERHIMHNREPLKTDLYKSGDDPTLNREIGSTYILDQGELHSRVAEGQVVKETIKEVELHKVQPIVHREREQKEIRHIVEPHREAQIKDVKLHHYERDIDLGVRSETSTLPTSRSVGHAPNMESTREFLAPERQHQNLPVKIDEHVHRTIEEHVHPVIYKEVLKPKVTEETHHIYEKVREAPIETYEVQQVDRSRGVGGQLLDEAKRDFFAHESARGIVLGDDHNCDRDCQHQHQHQHLTHSHTHAKAASPKKTTKTKKNKDKNKNKDKPIKPTKKNAPVVVHEVVHVVDDPSLPKAVVTEPILAHHQNIGGHHLPAVAAVPYGHNTAYDAALGSSSPPWSTSLASASGSYSPGCQEAVSVHQHSTRDADLVNKQHDKHIAKEEKELGKEKEKEKIKKQEGKSHTVV